MFQKSSSVKRGPGLWPAGVIIFAVLVAYSNVFSGQFVFDDESSIGLNPTIKHLWPPWEALSPPRAGGLTVGGRPLLNFTLAVNYAFGDISLWGYHALNVAIHLGATLALFGIIRRTLERPRLRERFGAVATPLALAAAVLWAVHPLLTQSVIYIIQRAESLMGFFYLLTLYFFLRGAEREKPGVWFGLAVGACLLGMASKEVMVSAPLMVLLYDRTFISESVRAALRLRRWFYVGLASTWALLAWLVVSSGGNRGGSIGPGVGVGWWKHLLTQFPAVMHYLRLAVWPSPLVFEYEPAWVHSAAEILPSAVPVALLLAGTIVALWRRWATGFLGAWFFLILSPTSLLPAPSQLIAEHRMYLPLAAVVILLVGMVYRLAGFEPKARNHGMIFGGFIFALVAFGLGLLTLQRNRDYRSATALWSDTVAKRPRNALAHYMLGEALDKDGDFPQAAIHYQEALRLRPDFPLAYLRLGAVDDRLGQVPEAIASYQMALRLKPDFLLAHVDLGSALAAAGRVAEAIDHFEAAVTIDQNNAELHYDLANAFAQDGRNPGEAIWNYETALQLKPDYPAAHFNLANVLAGLGQRPGAIEHYQAALRLSPDYAKAHYNLANLLALSGRQLESISEYEAVLRLDPADAEAHNNLGSALFELGRLTEAATHYEEALRLKPGFVEARKNRARVRLKEAGGRPPP